jgi:hypothetical protein
MSTPLPLPPLPVSPAYQPAQNDATGEWKAEAVRGFWSTAKDRPAVFVGFVAAACFGALIWFFETRQDAILDKFFTKLDKHVATLKERDVDIAKENATQFAKVVTTTQETVKDVKEMSERSQLALERAYQIRSNDRPIGVSSKP